MCVFTVNKCTRMKFVHLLCACACVACAKVSVCASVPSSLHVNKVLALAPGPVQDATGMAAPRCFLSHTVRPQALQL